MPRCGEKTYVHVGLIPKLLKINFFHVDSKTKLPAESGPKFPAATSKAQGMENID